MSTATVQDHIGFKTTLSAVRRSIFLPKYYNPEIVARLAALKQTHALVTLGELVQQKYLSATTGDEIGKMAYGTGTIPFV
jgi:type I restriction enzyme M protein